MNKEELLGFIDKLELELLEIEADETLVAYKNKYTLQSLLIQEVMKMNYPTVPAIGTARIIV